MLDGVPTHPETLFHLCFTEIRRPGKGEENHLLAGYGTDVVVQGHDLDAGNLRDRRFQDRTSRFNQMRPYLLEQVPPLRVERLDQVLFGCGQNALEAHDEEIAEQVGVDVIGASAHVIVLEATDCFADGGLDLSVGFHEYR